MSQIKEVIEELATNWSWSEIFKHPVRRQLITNREGSGLRVLVGNVGSVKHEFTFRHRRQDGDVRIWARSAQGLLQWRSDPYKGDRLIYRDFSPTSQTERLGIEEIFMDPTDIDEGEVAMFEMLYPDLVPLLPLFKEALSRADTQMEKTSSMGKLYGT